jgi:membrane-associated protease RseP (regulator of RpoE activity)
MKLDVDETKPLPWSPGYVPGAQPRARHVDRPVLHLLLLAATLVTTTMAGARMAGVEPTSLGALLSGLPFSLTLLAILITHESGHYLMCRRHGIAASLPYVLPAPPFFLLGTFGAVIRVRSRFPDRRALFDMGAAGPWAGFVVALAAMVVGLRLSTVGASVPAGPTILLGDSLLTSFLARVILHAEPDTVMLHPVAFAAWAGLLVTSLNLLPAGQLDGGHVLYAARGRRPTLLPAMLLAVLVWLGATRSPFWLVWSVVAAAMLVMGHPHTINDALPLGRARRVGAVASMLLFLVTFVPEPIRIVS